jgi:uncharacterized repeat protein (TIGR03803 family)
MLPGMRGLAWLLAVGLLLTARSEGQIEVLVDLGGVRGEVAKGSMILAGTTLYGFTAEGGTGGNGVIFSVQTDGTDFEVLQNFAATPSPFGVQPHHGYLTLENDTLLRPILRGGADGQGTMFSLSTDGSAPGVLHTFTGNPTVPAPRGDGAQPHSGLLAAGGGLYYGMTALGGASGNGVIYSFDTATNAVETLYDFSLPTGGQPHGQLIWDSTGTVLLGMTRYGGSGVGNAKTDNLAPGVVFRFDPLAGTYDVLADFSSVGGGPALSKHGILTLGTGSQAGTAFGLTAYGGLHDEGTLFSLDETGGIPMVLHDFGSGSDGAEPYGSLVLGPDDLFYGMTRTGGAFNDGTLFRVAQDGSRYETLASFQSATTGREPIDNITFSADGQFLYGLTQFGGTGDGGTIFRFALVPEPSPTVLIAVSLVLAWCLGPRRQRRIGWAKTL